MNQIRILLVDDDEEDFLITEHLLLNSSTSTYEIEWQADYEAAQACLQRQQFDIVLVDYLLGGKTGIDFITENREAGLLVPTILLTGLGDYDTDLKAMHSGAVDYLNKNELTGAILERSIRYALRQFQHQELLRESEQRLKLALDTTGAASYDWDLSRQSLVYDQRLLEIYGKVSPEFRFWEDGLHPEDLEQTQIVFATAIRERSLFEHRFRILRPNQEVRHIHARAALQVSDSGQLLRVTGVLFDVSEQTRAEQQLRQLTQELEKRVQERTHELKQTNQQLQTNQARLQVLYDISGEAYQELTLEPFLMGVLQKLGEYLQSPHAVIQIPESSPLTSLLPQALISYAQRGSDHYQTWSCVWQNTDVLTEQELYRLPEAMVQEIQSEADSLWKQSVYQQDDVLFDMIFALNAAGTSDAGLQKFMTQVSAQVGSIIQQYMSVQTIRDNEERLKQFMEAIPVGIFALGANGLPYYANRAAKELLGQDLIPNLTPAQLGEAYQLYREGAQEIYPAAETPLFKALQGLDSYVDDLEVRKPEATTNLQLWGRPVRNSQEQILYSIATFSDITEIKQTQHALIQARQKAENANRAKSDFLANMSHEIRTPMNAILGFAQLLQQDPELGPEQQKKLKIIIQSGEHLLGLISDILEMSKIEAGHITLELETVDVYQMLSELESIFVAKAREKNIDFTVSSSPSIPRYLKLDKQKLRQVLFNLLSNAFKFTPKGEIEVQLKARPKDDHTYTLTFKVQDTGMGIAPEEQDKVFQNFEQTSSGRNVQGGTGLGLAISQKFIQMMGGCIQLKSKVQEGTCFYFSIDVALGENPESLYTQSAKISFDFSHLDRPQVLIVDDQKHNRDLLRLILEPHGFVVSEVQDGQEALDHIQQACPDLVLLDLSMPVMDGITCLKQLRKEPKTQDLCVIMITANAFASDRQKSLLTGANDFIPKPFKTHKVLETIAKHLCLEEIKSEPEVLPAFEFAHATPSELVSKLPSEVAVRMSEATIRGDQEVLLALIQETEEFDAALAKQLQEWASLYCYEEILDFLEAAILAN